MTTSFDEHMNLLPGEFLLQEDFADHSQEGSVIKADNASISEMKIANPADNRVLDTVSGSVNSAIETLQERERG